jgi:hypothetical protein
MRLLEKLEAILLGQPPASPPSAQPSATLTGILNGWWIEARAAGRKPSTFESYRNTIAGLVEFLGHDDAGRVTAEDVVRFKDYRLTKVSAKTVKDSDLAGLKTVFGWAVGNRRLAQNPATGISIRLGKPKRLRGKGLTEEETKALLRASLSVQRGGEAERTFAAKRWVPVTGRIQWREGGRARPAAPAGRGARGWTLDHHHFARSRDCEDQRGSQGGPASPCRAPWLPRVREGRARRPPIPQTRTDWRCPRAAPRREEPAG